MTLSSVICEPVPNVCAPFSPLPVVVIVVPVTDADEPDPSVVSAPFDWPDDVNAPPEIVDHPPSRVSTAELSPAIETVEFVSLTVPPE